MLRRFSVNFAIFSLALDAALILLALRMAVALRPGLSSLPGVAHIPAPLHLPLWLYGLFPTLWVVLLYANTVYDGRRNLRVTNEILSLTWGSLLAVVVLAGTLYFSYRDLSRFLFILFAGSAYAALLGWRLLYRLAFRRGWVRGVQGRRILVIGAGQAGRELAVQVRAWGEMGLEVVGFLDDDPEKRAAQPDILGTLAEALAIIAQTGAQDVVIALPSRAYRQINGLVADLHTQPVHVWVIPDYYHLALYKAHIEELAGIPLLDLRAPALSDGQRLIKRLVDLGIVILTLPLSLPLMGVIALAVRREDGGPALFRQERVGENGKLFEILKFRTMRPNAEAQPESEAVDASGQVLHKRRDDPRVTPLGHFLRRTSLDELPQVFNVLRGEMSLVGPRPELPYLVERYAPWQRRRFTIPPGITGWWQVNGRSDKPMHLHTEDDLYYVQNYSLWLDLQILAKTVAAVVWGKGAF